MRILAIETSCDETAVSVLQTDGRKFNILSNIVSSQVKIHAKWGGVVPSLAKREHQKNLIPVLMRALKESNLLISKQIISAGRRTELQKIKTILEREQILYKKTESFLKKYKAPKIDLIAVTNGPGLEPALWVGVNFAKALASAWDKPLIPINHMEGHLFSVFLHSTSLWTNKFQIPKIKFPAVALLVSGGHTELILVKNWLKYKMLGQTRDDAAGEAFDKVAKMLDLGYPGGPAIAAAAAKFPIFNFQFPIKLPRPMLNSKDYDFSFSGLKTAVLYKLKEIRNITPEIKAVFCREFQQATIDVLVSKTIRAAREFSAKGGSAFGGKVKTIILAGGVAANKELRKQFQKKIAITNDRKYLLNLLMPEIKFTGDNAAMITLAAYFRFIKKKKPADWQALKADGNLKIV